MATIIPDKSNLLFNIAVDLVNQSSRNIFLTGKAGTGKTTFLKYIREICPKQMAVVAPTGVAAINAGGVTIHSFFQLPISPFIPGAKGFGNHNDIADRHNLLSRLRLNSEKRKIIQELELLVIDEISMVRCDTLDALDTILRHVRHRWQEPFGGVQVLFIGDMYQLPPVVPDQEWQILSEYYNGPYFFDSKVIEEASPVYIEFTKIYRQSEERFIQLLNQVRNNTLDEEGIIILESRYFPYFSRAKDDGYIILTTHNRKADQINAEQLQGIPEKPRMYKAEIKDDFPEKSFPAEEQFVLKPGAQVMFIKNDTADRGKRYFNGKIGTVKKLENDKIFVHCRDESDDIEVTRENWENIKYTVDPKTRKLNEEVLGSFTQFPLRLAWAITIHKSQGLTFEKAIIDAEAAFAPGQIYVALSRCTSLEGMVLQTKVKPSSLYTDSRIINFSKNNLSTSGLLNELATSKQEYEQKLLLSVFDFTPAFKEIISLISYLKENSSSFNKEAQPAVQIIQEKVGAIQDVALKFQAQLKNLFTKDTLGNPLLLERNKAAAQYFNGKINELTNDMLQSKVFTDSRQHAKEYNDSMREIWTWLSLKGYLMQGFDDEFSIESYQYRKNKFTVPGFPVNAYAGASRQSVETLHPILHSQLRKHRDAICEKTDLPVFLVAGSNTLIEMSRFLPQSLTELRKISGFGDARIEKYGQGFLEIIIKYSRERELTSLIHEKSPKRERKEKSKEKTVKNETKIESFRLFKEGLSVAQIANQRKLTIQTVEGHLAHFIQRGEIHIDELLSPEKLLLIEPHLKDYTGGSITSVKEKLGDLISFGEIRLAIAWSQFQKMNGF